ncbi:hypothetical protein GCM10007962_30650 [Yeosuana aromativorans]|uniref:Histidinol-phosphatase n=1 Tax=Yeosuana aromativorans TaxID=288019 RepID=A0A8J3FLF2_9FLAO|nr:histidinol-phosphatase [Yeosuana aromativorans]GGK34078.1 hypothetical protein GCM10007962_30650 [Yeosuana aromativorans]
MGSYRFFSWLSCFFILLMSCAESIQPKKWFKGNLHTHSYWSDGDEFPEMIMDWYKTNNYHFVVLSDHNTLAEGEKWKRILNDTIYRKAFKNYLNKYNRDSSVVYKKNLDTLFVKLKTFEEYKPLFEEKDRFIMLPSEEISNVYKNKPYHVNAINIQKRINPQKGGISASELLQYNIDEVYNQRKETGIPMIAQINHPNFRDAIVVEDMKQLNNNRFFEVFNGHPYVKNNGDDLHLSTEEMWDLINILYLNNGKELLYGTATDDSHNYHKIGEKWSNAGRGWVEVKADSLNAESLITAMENGQFYASTGIELEEVEFSNNSLKLQIKAESEVSYKIQFIGCYLNEEETRVLGEVEGTQAEFNLNKNILFVRAKIISNKPPERPMNEMKFEQAWTQPVRPI